jgi:PAS domain S-box-containing protein
MANVLNETKRKLAEIKPIGAPGDGTPADATRYRDFAEAVSDWLWETDAEGRLTFMSDDFYEATGFAPESVIGKTRSELGFSALSPADEVVLREALTEGKPIRNVVSVGVMPNGRRMWTRVGGKPVFDANGRLSGYRGATSDVSELYETQAKVAESEARLSDFARATGDWFWEMGPDLRFSFVSENLSDYVDRPASWYIGKRRDEVANVDAAMARHIEDLLERRPFRDFRYARTDKSGRQQWFSISGRPVFDADGNFRGYRGVGSDATEAVEAEHQLERFAAVIEASNEAIIALDKHAVITGWNPGAERLYGYSADEAVGRPLSILTEGEVQARQQRELIARAMNGESLVGIEGLRTTKDGRELNLSLSLSPIRDAGGEIVGLCGVAMDITERIRAETELRQRETQLRLVTDAIPALICYCDKDLVYLFANRTACIWYDRPLEDIIGRTSQELLGAEVIEVLRPRLEDVVAGRTVTYEDERVYPDGIRRAVETTYIPHLGSGGEFLGFYVVVTDVTERRRAAQQTEAQRAELQELVSQKDRLFSIIAHDLKNPMSTIVGFGTILAERADILEPATVGEYAAMMRQAADQASLVLQDLMDWARSQDGRMIFEPDVIDVGEMIAHNLRLIEPQALAKSIVLDGGNASGLTAWADPHMSHTVMRNLLGNAVKFTPEGGRISIGVRPNGDWIEIAVSDTGVGMPEARAKNLFRLDVTESTDGTRGEKGTGFGLHLCKSLVERHGGAIWVDSREGEGSTFSFQLPRARAAY